MSPRSLPTGWRTKRLVEVTLPTESWDPRTVAHQRFVYVDISSVDNSRGIIVEPKVIETNRAPSRARKLIREADVIFATTRPYLRVIAMVPSELNGQVCSTGFCVLRADASQVLPKWIFYLCRSDIVLSQVQPMMRGASYPAVTDKDVRAAEIPVPPLEEQRRIVARIEDLQTRTDRLRSLQAETLAELEVLPAAILDRAFSGQL